MGQRPLTALGQQMLASLPPALRRSPDYQAIMHAASREAALLETAVEQVRAQFNPVRADLLLGAWEAEVKLPVGGLGATVAQRQARILARLRKLLGSSEGLEWEQTITDLVGPGWSYLEHIEGDPSSPPASTISIALPFPPSGSSYIEALREIREVTPAHLDIRFSSGHGFILDESHLDLEGFGEQDPP